MAHQHMALPKYNCLYLQCVFLALSVVVLRFSCRWVKITILDIQVDFESHRSGEFYK